MNFTPPVLSVVISTVRYCTSLQRRACGIKAEIINEHLEMNSLWRLVGVTLSGEQAGLPSPKAVTDAWGGDLSDLGHSQELQFVSTNNTRSSEGPLYHCRRTTIVLCSVSFVSISQFLNTVVSKSLGMLGQIVLYCKKNLKE